MKIFHGSNLYFCSADSVEYLFHILFDICISSLVKRLFIAFAYFLVDFLNQ
jgi:hypothetical protein